LAGSYDSSLYAFGLADGKRAWSFETGNYINGTAAVEGDRAVVGGCDANLHVFDLAWGKQLGAVDTGAYIAGSAAMKDGIAYVGNYAGRFLAIEVAELRVLWTFTLADERKGFTASPAVADKYIVIGAKDGFLYCLDRETGVQVWRYRGSDEYVSSPLAGGGRVLSVSADGESTLLELESGRVLSTYRIGATVHGSPALAHGYLAVAALDGNVYVFKGEYPKRCESPTSSPDRGGVFIVRTA
jgi:outer membrane protein assembly factor BamB